MFVIYRRRQHHYLARAERCQRKSSFRSTHLSHHPKLRTKPPHLHPQPPTMRFVDKLRSECPRNQRVSRDICRPRLSQCACQREQHRSRCQRHHFLLVTHHITASVHHECLRREQRFNLLQQKRAFLAICDLARSGRVQHEECASHFRSQRRNTCLTRRPFS